MDTDEKILNKTKATQNQEYKKKDYMPQISAISSINSKLF